MSFSDIKKPGSYFWAKKVTSQKIIHILSIFIRKLRKMRPRSRFGRLSSLSSIRQVGDLCHLDKNRPWEI